MKRISTCMIAFVMLFTMACNPSKTLYLSNKTNQSITLMVDLQGNFNQQSQTSIFKDSLHGKHIDKHSILQFGKGDWNANDIESLKLVLAKTTVQVDGKGLSYQLPDNLKVAHYGVFVEELLVKIREPKQKR